jgi:hypothetical protein
MGAKLGYGRFDPQQLAVVRPDCGMYCGERTWLV